MSPVEAFLQRLQQHIQSQQGPNLGNVPVLSGLAQAVLRPAYNAAGDIGLGLEGTAKLGNYAAGEVVLGANQAQQNLHEVLPTVFTSPGDPNVLAQGPMHPQAALDAARNGPDSLTAWLAGALAMGLDPANLIPLPLGHAAQAEKAAAAVARKGARFGMSDEFMADFMRELQQNANEYDLQAAKKVVLGDVTPEQFDQDQAQTALQALREKRPIDEIFNIADQAKAVGQAQQDVPAAKVAYDQAGTLYRDVQRQKKLAMDEALDQYRVNGRLPRGFKNTPEYSQLEDQTKRAVELLNPQGPQNRTNFQDFLGQKRDVLTAARQQQTQAQDELRQAFQTPQAPVTPEQASFLSQEPVPGQPQVPSGVQANTDIAGLNEKLNAEELATTPVRTPDETGWFVEPDPAQGDVATNPVKAAATKVANPVKAQDGSVPAQEPGYVSHMWDLIKAGLSRGAQRTKESYSQPFKKLGLRDVAGVWAGTNIETVRNAIMDKVYNAWLLGNEGISKRLATTAEKVIGQRVKAGETDPVRLLGPIADYLDTLGIDTIPTKKLPGGNEAIDAQGAQKLAQQIVSDLGGNFFKLEADNANHLAQMNGLQKALVGTGLQLASPVTAVTGLATAPLNLLMDLRHEVFAVVNNAAHMGARTAAFEDAFLPFLQNSAQDMLQRAAAEGKDVSLLTGKGFSRYGEVLATDGAFAPEQVTAQLGERYGAEWGRVVEQALQAGYDNSRRVLGNFADSSPAEDMVRRFVPFMSWSWRAYPRAAQYALSHPAVTVGLLHLLAADRANAQREGRPGYQVGTVAINKDTPLLGLLASVFTPEQEATVRLNPLALFSPVSGELLSVGMDNPQGEDQTAYQQAKNAVGMLGGSFNPLIQAGAYITDQDYQAPGAASRYAPVDYLTAQMGGPSAPTIQGPLRAARKLVSGQEDTYDPIEAKAKELVFERTGKPVSDPDNKQYALEIQHQTGVYLDAQRDYAQGGARRALVGAVSPVSVQATTATTEARRAASQDVPFSYDDIQAAKDQGLSQLVTAMNAANDQYYAQHPEAAVNKNAKLTTQDKEDPRLTAWEQEHVLLQKLAPSSYSKARAAYKATLGIK